jgi:probable HAF family extracellular repeat protein
MRRLFMVFGVVVLSSLVVSSAWGISPYVLTDLTPNGTQASATAINASGQIAGWYYTGGTLGSDVSAYRPFLYSGGAMTTLAMPSGRVGAVASAINNNGDVAGSCYTGAGAQRHAYLYSSHTATDLGTLPGGNDSGAIGINSIGQVVGDSNGSGYSSQPFLYTDHSMTRLPTLPGGSQFGGAGPINDNYIGGYSNTPTGVHIFRYNISTGVETDLGALPNSTVQGVARGMNDDGVILGWCQVNGTIFHGMVSVGDTMSDLPSTVPGFVDCLPWAINNHDDIVGAVESEPNHVDHAFINTDGHMYDLNGLIPAGSGLTLKVAQGINDSGQIVGIAVNPQGQFHAFLLTPTPEPSTLVLLGVGAISLLGYVWRKRMA